MPRIVTWLLLAVAWTWAMGEIAAQEVPSSSVWIVHLDCHEDDCSRQAMAIRREAARRGGRVAMLPHPANPGRWLLLGADEETIARMRAHAPVLEVRRLAYDESRGALDGGYQIAGQVVDQYDAPVPNAWVSATEFESGQLAGGFSDASGAFQIDIPFAGDWLVIAQGLFDHGFSSPAWVRVPPGATDVRLVVRKGDHLIHGVVRDADGLPVADAMVMAETLVCVDGNLYQAYTDEEGHYELRVPAGEYEVSVDLVPQPRARHVDLRDQDSVELDFQLPTVHSISGQVRRGDGQPVSEAPVRAMPSSACRIPRRWADQDETDASGRYALFLGEISYQVLAEWPEDIGYGVVTTTLTPREVRSDLDFVLPELYPVQGTTQTHSGGVLYGPFRVVASTPDGQEVAYTQPDDSGVFTFTLMAGRYVIGANIVGYPDPPTVTIEVTGPVTGIALRSPEAFTISGHVMDRSGQPMEDVTIMAQPVGEGEPESAVRGTDASGAYTLTVPAGVYEIRAVADVPFPSRVVTVMEDVTGIDFTYPVTYHVRGRVQDASGHPITLGRVYYIIPGKHPGNDYIQSELIYYDGSFAMDLPAGAYWLEAEACGYARGRRTIRVLGDISVTLTLTPLSHRIRGRVTTADGAAACGVPIVARVDEALYEGETMADWVQEMDLGTYELRVGPGEYVVHPASERYPFSVPSARRIAVPPDAENVDFVVFPKFSEKITLYLPISLRDGR
ncbi:MAG TPA: carboxypeptidase regulatory-like domain-containing protein [Caldilineae bacterium]|nr:carboxypeptidase regulatory-like domain-containing protein [Caldilineae bacterium]